MAQLLVFQRDNFNSVDDSGSYKTGDVVVIAEDDHVFGKAEQVNPFKVVQVPGVAADYQYLLEPEPSTLRDVYPRSMLQIKRLIPALSKTVRAESRGRRKYKTDNVGNITRKIIGGV